MIADTILIGTRARKPGTVSLALGEGGRLDDGDES